MDSSIVLSFSKWPIKIVNNSRLALSPISSKILTSADVKIQTLLPLSKQQFMLINHLSQKNKKEVERLYREEKLRRKKKIDILKALWNKASKKDRQRKSEPSSDYICKDKKTLSQRNSSKSKSRLSKMKRSSSPILFKVKNGKKSSAYLDYYSNSKNNFFFNENKKYSYQDESTKSKKHLKKRVNSNCSPNKDYFGTQTNPNSDRKNNSSREKSQIYFLLLEEMNEGMQKWTMLDKQHREEILNIGCITEREKKRLLKIQQIEKEKVKQEMEEIRMKMSTSKQLEKRLF